jgi:hypothetical protein
LQIVVGLAVSDRVVGTGFTVAVTAVRDADTQPKVVLRASA